MKLCGGKRFCAVFTSGGKLVYVGDTDEKWAYFDQRYLAFCQLLLPVQSVSL